MTRRIIDATFRPGMDPHKTPLSRDLKKLSRDPQIQKVAAIRLQKIIEEYAARPPENPLKMPRIEPLQGTNGLIQARLAYRTMQFRLVFDVQGQYIRMLTAFAKKTQETPPLVIDRAHDRQQSANES
ncbi:type II toxin-antitoxin system RelE/ParE family toxin [Kocuria carniphila]|uniref:type II toxin-antitoxin system RelE/ParE family toxin n=1 Tax=Kocuria carniphila TaxID=262208 RepID=UPI0034CDB343